MKLPPQVCTHLLFSLLCIEQSDSIFCVVAGNCGYMTTRESENPGRLSNNQKQNKPGAHSVRLNPCAILSYFRIQSKQAHAPES